MKNFIILSLIVTCVMLVIAANEMKENSELCREQFHDYIKAHPAEWMTPKTIP